MQKNFLLFVHAFDSKRCFTTYSPLKRLILEKYLAVVAVTFLVKSLSTVHIKEHLFIYLFKYSVSIFDNILKAECRIQRLELWSWKDKRNFRHYSVACLEGPRIITKNIKVASVSCNVQQSLSAPPNSKQKFYYLGRLDGRLTCHTR